VTAIVALLAMRSFACFLAHAYWSYATARSRNVPPRFLLWFRQIVIEDWVRYRDGAWTRPAVRLARVLGARYGPADRRTCGRGPAIDHPTSPDLASPKGGVPPNSIIGFACRLAESLCPHSPH